MYFVHRIKMPASLASILIALKFPGKRDQFHANVSLLDLQTVNF